MNSPRFRAKVDSIRSDDPRFAREAYVYLTRVLDYSVEKISLQCPPPHPQHVSCRTLLEDFCELALREMGPMAMTVMNEWGIKSGYNVGEMVFHLIDAGVFGKQPSDRLDDFKDFPPFSEILEKPYLPRTSHSHQSSEK